MSKCLQLFEKHANIICTICILELDDLYDIMNAWYVINIE